MTEMFEHNKGDHEDPVAGPTWTVAVVGVALPIVSVLGTAALYYDVRDREFETKVEGPKTVQLEKLNAMQTARLTGEIRMEQRLEAPEGALVIPIDKAMEIVVAEMSN